MAEHPLEMRKQDILEKLQSSLPSSQNFGALKERFHVLINDSRWSDKRITNEEVGNFRNELGEHFQSMLHLKESLVHSLALANILNQDLYKQIDK